MTRRAATATQADMERAIRAAKRQGVAVVRVRTKDAEFAFDLREPVELRPLSTVAVVAPRKGRALC